MGVQQDTSPVSKGVRRVPVDSRLAGVTMIRAFSRGHARHPSQLMTATGFFFGHGDERYLITCRHVLLDEDKHVYPDSIAFSIHTGDMVHDTRIVTLDLYKGDRAVWHDSTRPGTDIAVIRIDSLLGVDDHLHFWTQNDFFRWTSENTLSIDSALIVPGFPEGASDITNTLPVTKMAALATPIGIGYNNEPYFLIDGNLYPGNSGSPVITRAPTLTISIGGKMHRDYRPGFLLGVDAGPHDERGYETGLHRVFFAELIQDIVDANRAKMAPEPTGEAANPSEVI